MTCDYDHSIVGNWFCRASLLKLPLFDSVVILAEYLAYIGWSDSWQNASADMNGWCLHLSGSHEVCCLILASLCMSLCIFFDLIDTALVFCFWWISFFLVLLHGPWRLSWRWCFASSCSKTTSCLYSWVQPFYFALFLPLSQMLLSTTPDSYNPCLMMISQILECFWSQAVISADCVRDMRCCLVLICECGCVLRLDFCTFLQFRNSLQQLAQHFY